MVMAGASCGWTIEDVAAVAEGRAGLALSREPGFRRGIEAGAARVRGLWKRGEPVYGVNTGCGASGGRTVPKALVPELPRNLPRFHRCGLGAFLDGPAVRAVLAARLCSLAGGHSGVRWALLEALTALERKGVLPLIPEEGSVGASGDLTPLAYIAGVLQGEGEVLYRGRRISASKALRSAGLQALRLAPKESLALMNGTSLMTALGCLAFVRAERLERLACRITAIGALALRGDPGHFHRRLFELKPHPGQARAAAWIRSDLGGAPRPRRGTPQDPYSLRCAPHVIGVLGDTLAWCRSWLERELNSVNDNPLIDPDSGEVFHGGNFYGGHVAAAMDALKAATAGVADLLDRQLLLLCDPRTNRGLPAGLSGAGRRRLPVNHGFKAVQIGASAWTAEALKLTMPAASFSRSTECHNQDKVSMGAIAARDCVRVLELSEQVAAAALLGAAQGLELRGGGRPSRSPELAAFLRALRKAVPFLKEDRALDGDLRVVLALVRGRRLPLYEG